MRAKVNALRERWLSNPECPSRGVSKPQSASGEELRPLFGPLRALTSSLAEHPERASAASGMPSVYELGRLMGENRSHRTPSQVYNGRNYCDRRNHS